MRKYKEINNEIIEFLKNALKNKDYSKIIGTKDTSTGLTIDRLCFKLGKEEIYLDSCPAFNKFKEITASPMDSNCEFIILSGNTNIYLAETKNLKLDGNKTKDYYYTNLVPVQGNQNYQSYNFTTGSSFYLNSPYIWLKLSPSSSLQFIRIKGPTYKENGRSKFCNPVININNKVFTNFKKEKIIKDFINAMKNYN